MTTQLSIPQNALVVKETSPFTALCFTTRTTLQNLSQFAPGVAENLYREVKRLDLNVTGTIQWIYTGATGDPTKEFQLEIVLPVEQAGALSSEFTYKNFPIFRCAAYTYTGPWSDFPMLYDALFAQFYRQGYQNDGHVCEVYILTDLANPANCITEIQIGIV